jgi:triosephosphate isomerase
VKKPILIANWKMYVQKPEEAKRYAHALKRRAQLLSKAEVTLAPAFTLLPTLALALGKSKTIRLGAQTLSAYTEAPHTGDISAAMLKAVGATSVIIGHSERRHAGESDEQIRQELRAAHSANLAAVLCIGEEERDPSGSHFTVIEKQLAAALKDKTSGKLLIAYEPVWAIGKSASDAMRPNELEEMAIFIRKTLADVLGRQSVPKVPILYGGSVEPENAGALMKEGNVSGFLIGHASADTGSLLQILEACLKH